MDWLHKGLAETMDARMATKGFTRSSQSPYYKRRLGECFQELVVDSAPSPRYQPSADIHITPRCVVMMGSVGDQALKMVDGDTKLLAMVPPLVMNQPIEYCAPRDETERWFATGEAETLAACHRMCSFVLRWGVPFLDQLSCPGDLVRVYEQGDGGTKTRQDHWFVQVAAAYVLLGRRNEGREMIGSKFASPGQRRRFDAVFRWFHEN